MGQSASRIKWSWSDDDPKPSHTDELMTLRSEFRVGQAENEEEWRRWKECTFCALIFTGPTGHRREETHWLRNKAPDRLPWSLFGSQQFWFWFLALLKSEAGWSKEMSRDVDGCCTSLWTDLSWYGEDDLRDCGFCLARQHCCPWAYRHLERKQVRAC